MAFGSLKALGPTKLKIMAVGTALAGAVFFFVTRQQGLQDTSPLSIILPLISAYFVFLVPVFYLWLASQSGDKREDKEIG